MRRNLITHRLVALAVASLAVVATAATGGTTAASASSPRDSSQVHIVNNLSGLCIAPPGSGTTAVSAGCVDNLASNTWQWVYIGIGSDGSPYWHIKNGDGDQPCLNVSKADRKTVYLGSCSTDFSSYWRFAHPFGDPFATEIINRMVANAPSTDSVSGNPGYLVIQNNGLGSPAFVYKCCYNDQDWQVVDYNTGKVVDP